MPPPLNEATAAGAAPPRARATAWLLGLVAASLLTSFWLLIDPTAQARGHTVDADGYSRSALGHIGFLEVLRAVEDNVRQSRSGRRTVRCGLLVYTEPRRLDAADEDEVAAACNRADCTLLVLGKRLAIPAQERPWWAERVDFQRIDVVQGVLDDFLGALDLEVPVVERFATNADWTMPAGWPAPAIPGPVQLLTELPPGWSAVVECAQGTLLARCGRLRVLADPDLIANHGLLRGANAELVERMVRHVHGSGAIVVDETQHGHVIEKSIFQLAGRYPYALVTCHLLLLLALAAGAAAVRQGPLTPAAPAVAAGKDFLIDNVAALLAVGGGAGHSLRQYARLRLHRLGALLHAPRGLDDARRRDYVLARLPADHRDRLASALALEAHRPTPAAALAAARKIHQLTEGPHPCSPPTSPK
jgi:hypothetical protein